MIDKLCMKFRWIFSIDRETTLLLKNIKIDHVNKKIYTQLFDGKIGSQTTFEWVNKISPEKILSLTTLDASGREIYSINFHKPKVMEHKCSFNYTSSKNALRNVIISYEKEEVDSDVLKCGIGSWGPLMSDIDVFTKILGMEETDARTYLNKLRKNKVFN